MKNVNDPKKLDIWWDGPYPVECVHVNGNVTIALKPGVFERSNIRRVKPYREPTVSLKFSFTEWKNDLGSKDIKG